jgi:hypothetical protein
MRSLSAGRNAFFVRILVTVTPRMYREVLALSIQRRRPDFEVLLAPPESLDGEAELFRPHVLVEDADEAGLPPALAQDEQGVVCRVRILIADRIDATIELDGMTSEIHDVCLEDLFEVLEEAEGMSRGDGGG